MDTTANYKLKKPVDTDGADISTIGDDMDSIDGELKKGEDHRADANIHVTATQKAAWTAKAEKSDIPTSLPANGGHAASADNANYANSAGSAPANGGTATYASYPNHASGFAEFALRGNYISYTTPSGGNDGDTWDQV